MSFYIHKDRLKTIVATEAIFEVAFQDIGYFDIGTPDYDGFPDLVLSIRTE